MKFNPTIKNLNRISEIIAILLKYGFEEIVASTALRKIVPRKSVASQTQIQQRILMYSRWERIRMAVEDLGPTFIKFAQLLSSRADLIPEPLIAEFEKLHDQVKPFKSRLAKKIIEKETGHELSEIFEYFHDKPFASASIGQAHRARLYDGSEVIVKVQRPFIVEKIATDIEILRLIAEITTRYLRRQGIHNPDEIISAFEKSIKRELLYTIEAKNIQQFRNFYAEENGFYVPKAYLNYSTNKVIVVEFIKGCKITDVTQIKRFGINPKTLAERGLDLYLSQMFLHGFFHADPHPGNVLVREDGTICLIDFGIVGKLIKKDKYAFAGIFTSMAEHDSKRMADSFRRLSTEDHITDYKAFEYDLFEAMEEFTMLDPTHAGMDDFRKNLQNIIYNHKMKVPDSVFLILRALVLLESIGKKLHPELSLRERLAPYHKKIIQEQNSPQNLLKELVYRFTQLNYFVRSLPPELNQILKNIRKGKLHIEYELQGVEPLINRLDRLTNRITLTLIISSIVLASAIIATADFAEKQMSFLGIPYISFIGLLIAGGLSAVLILLSIRRRNNGNGNNNKPI